MKNKIITSYLICRKKLKKTFKKRRFIVSVFLLGFFHLLTAGGELHSAPLNYRIISKFTNSISEPSQQDEKIITGLIVDEKGEPIIGANVLLKGSSNGTVTDIDGNFSLHVSSDDILLISYIGYQSMELDTKGKTSLKVVLKEDSKALNELLLLVMELKRKQI